MFSWIESANDPKSDFPLANLPYGVFRAKDLRPATGVVIGDKVLDLRNLVESIPLPGSKVLAQTSLAGIMSLPRPQQSALRDELTSLLEDRPGRLRDHKELSVRFFSNIADVEWMLPVSIGDFTDFYASIDHAQNVGAMFRPDNPLMPNYRYLPVGYHGRSSSIVVSGTPVRRPTGQLPPVGGDLLPRFGPTRKLDYELELGIWIGKGNELGHPVPLSDAGDHIFGVSILNDWSARDIQKWEYQPLGPFLGKSFATTISPLIVTDFALEPYRTACRTRGAEDPQLLDYLCDQNDRLRGGIDLCMEVFISSRSMREQRIPPVRISSGNFKDMYWTIQQMVTHHASNGCNLRTGDLIGSGTVSGQSRESRGCLLERNWCGTHENPCPANQREPFELPTGELRDFLEDGDEVTMTAYCERPGLPRIGLGTCRGTIVAK